jgi:hypothetical protein
MHGPKRKIGQLPFLTNPATTRRVAGATTKTTQNAIGQLKVHAFIHVMNKPSIQPVAFNVDTPDTMQDMIPDRIRPNKYGAKRAGSITTSFIDWIPNANH